MLKINIFVSILCILFPLEVWADLTASVDTQQVSYGETFEFRLTYDGADGGSLQPDLSVLQKDFNIYSTSSSMNSQFINGVVSQKREWVLTLLPRDEGLITIPAISAGKYSSQPIKIEVLSADKIGQKQKNTNNDNGYSDKKQIAAFSADWSLENENPYIGQGIAAVLTIHDNRGLQLSREPYFENDADWTIKRIGNPDVTNKNGESITELSYIIYPQKSGIVELPRAIIEGYYVVYDNARKKSFGGSLLDLLDMGGMLGEQKPVLFKSKPETVNVQAIPAEFKGKSWVPAEALTATAQWLDKNPKFKVGETVAREIVVVASGVDESQLPNIKFDDSTVWKQYPDKPQYGSEIHNGKLISQEVVRVVYIPQQAGKLKLPEIRIPWFNVTTQKTQEAVIKGEEIEVYPNEAYEAVAEVDKEKVTPQVPEKQQSGKSVNNKNRQSVQEKDVYITLITVLAAFMLGLLVSFLFFGRKKENIKENTETDSYKNIKKALFDKDYRGVRDNLIRWGQVVFPENKINNLRDLAEIVGDDDFSGQCELINAVLYAGTDDTPDEKIIINAIKKAAKNKVTKTEKPLPNLYK